MDMRTGEIGPLAEMEKRVLKLFLRPVLTAREMRGGTIFKPVRLEFLSRSVRKMLLENGRAQISRNSKCPCGSGKRFKRCCMMK